MILKTDYNIFLHFLAITIYVIILLICIFCYWHILFVVRRQASVMSAHAAAASNTAQTQMDQIQTNVIKTMILVCGYYAVMWLPLQISHVIMVLSANPDQFLFSGYYVSLFIAFLYICTNPFIYATKFDPVKKVLLRVIPCKKTNIASTG